MKYFDKKKKQSVVLAPSNGEYLVKFKEGLQVENLMAELSKTERLKSLKWIPNSGVTTVGFEKAALRSTSVKNALDGIKEDESVEEVIPVFNDEEGFQRIIVPGRLLIAHMPGTKEDLQAKLIENGIEIFEISRFGNWMIVGLGDGQTIGEAIEYFNEFDEIEYSEPIYYGVNDAEEVGNNSLKWNLAEINIADAWNISTGSNDILIAVIDGMPDITHPAIQPAFTDGISDEWNFSGAQTKSSHSTQIISILAAKSDDIKGISPGAMIAPLSVTLDAQYYYQRAEAIFYLAEVMKKGKIGTRNITRAIANCSWKTSGDVGVIRSAIETAANAGVIFATSAGNEGSTGPHYPSDYSKTIKGVFSVAALAQNNRKAMYSNYSTTVSISAPGGAGLPFDADDIYCADINHSTSYTAGTSFATPHLVGTIALMLSVSPQMSFDEIKATLEKTAVSIKKENPEFWLNLGYGKLNAGAAVNMAGQATPIKDPQFEEPSKPDDSINPIKPEISEQPTETNVSSDTPSSISNGPKTTITENSEKQYTSPQIDALIIKISKELSRMSDFWKNGDLFRITLETNGQSTVIDCRVEL
jgi:subtilisin family serine protease